MGSERRELWVERRRTFWRAVTTPWLVPVWGIGLIYLLCLVNSMGNSVIGGMLTLRPHGCYIPSSFAVFDIDGTWVVTDNGGPEFDRLEDEGRSFAMFWYGRRGGGVGVWAPTWTTRHEEMGGYPTGDVNMAAARAALFDHMVAEGWGLNPALRTRDIHSTSANWGGQAVNLVSLFVACAFVGSGKRCFVKAMDRRTRRLLAGECPKCKYPFAGLPTPVCPECGERIE